MKIKKRVSVILSAILMSVTLLSGINTAFAEEVNQEQSFTQEDYDKGRSEGWIGEDVSLEDMQRMCEGSEKLDEKLDEDPNFIQVYSTSYKAGDIIITNATTMPFGHAGIFVGKNSILSIDGPGKHPSVKTVSQFRNVYDDTKSGKWTKVYRCTISGYGSKASTWAMNNYHGSNAYYLITNNLASKNPTYCSKIVYQSYRYGVGKKAIDSKYDYVNTVGPFDLTTMIKNINVIHKY